MFFYIFNLTFILFFLEICLNFKKIQNNFFLKRESFLNFITFFFFLFSIIPIINLFILKIKLVYFISNFKTLLIFFLLITFNSIFLYIYYKNIFLSLKKKIIILVLNLKNINKFYYWSLILLHFNFLIVICFNWFLLTF